MDVTPRVVSNRPGSTGPPSVTGHSGRNPGGRVYVTPGTTTTSSVAFPGPFLSAAIPGASGPCPLSSTCSPGPRPSFPGPLCSRTPVQHDRSVLVYRSVEERVQK